MDKNQKRLVVALAAALGCSLLVTAFLLGRASGLSAVDRSSAAVALERLQSEGISRPSPMVASSAISPVVPQITSTPADPASGSSAIVSSLPALPPRLEDTTSTSLPSRAAESAVRLREAPLSATDRQALSVYFAQVDRADDLGTGDPQAFAQSLMKSVMSGDFSGFDDLLTKAKTQRDRMRGVTPPPTCAAYHRLALVLANESVAMLDRMRGALAQGDTTALLTMASEGQTLEAKANQLKAMGDALKKQAGL